MGFKEFVKEVYEPQQQANKRLINFIDRLKSEY